SENRAGRLGRRRLEGVMLSAERLQHFLSSADGFRDHQALYRHDRGCPEPGTMGAEYSGYPANVLEAVRRMPWRRCPWHSARPGTLRKSVGSRPLRSKPA